MFDLRARECHFDTVHGTVDYLTDAKNVKGCLFQRNVGAKSVNRPSGNTCYGGEPLIPTYENQYDSIGNFAEYVVDAKSDDNWVIAKTDNHISNQRKYYILNKKYNPNEMTVEDIINTRIECFTDSSEFAKKCLSYGVLIKW